MPKFDDMWAGVLRIIEDCKVFVMVMEAEAAELCLRYRQNSMAYQILYYEGLGFTKYKLRFLSETVKIFERME